MIKTFLIGFISITLTACATGLTESEKREYRILEQEGKLIEKKNPTIAALLGMLPGGGSFYANEPGYGVVNFLFWPLSMCWDPVSGYESARAINFDLTKHKLDKDKEKEFSALDNSLSLEEIDEKTYLRKRILIEEKYNFN